jgi:hypothetical protein
VKLEAALIARIQAGLPELVPGKSLFHSHMPSEVKEGTLVMTRVPIVIDPYTGLRKGPFQVVCRSSTIEGAHDRASAIMKILATEGARQGEVNFKFIKPANEPLVFPRTDGGQFEASVNYNFAANWE